MRVVRDLGSGAYGMVNLRIALGLCVLESVHGLSVNLSVTCAHRGLYVSVWYVGRDGSLTVLAWEFSVTLGY